MADKFTSYDIQLVAAMSDHCVTADHFLGRAIDSAETYRQAKSSLAGNSTIVELIHTLYGRFENGMAMAICDFDSYDACALVYEGITGCALESIQHDMKGLPASAPKQEAH